MYCSIEFTSGISFQLYCKLWFIYATRFCDTTPKKSLNSIIKADTLPISRFILSLLIPCFLVPEAMFAQWPEPTKLITVRDGLPQSYVSDIFQDKNGFLWISTLNGFSRYDGRNFKYYWHNSGDTSTLSSNIILHIMDTDNNQLLICYDDGKLDLFNTETEKVIHLGNRPAFNRLKNEPGFFKSLINNKKGLCWMIASDGGVNQIDLVRNTLEHFSFHDLKLQAPVLGLAFRNHQLLLLTESLLSIRKKITEPVQSIYYPFRIEKVSDFKYGHFYSPWIRENGELIITDAGGMNIWNPATNIFNRITLPRRAGPGKSIVCTDHNGNFYFEYNGGIYRMDRKDSISGWAPATKELKGIPTSMYIDRSGVLWVGTNGYGLRQYNLNMSGIPGYANQHSFVIDVLSRFGIESKEWENTFLRYSVPFANRVAAAKNEIWIADVNRSSADPQLVLYTNNKLSEKIFRPANGQRKEKHAIRFISLDQDAGLWGINQNLNLLEFNTTDLSYREYGKIALDPLDAINGLVASGDNIFYISNPNNLVKFDASTGFSEQLTANLPSKDLLTISGDPDDKDILWIGTLSDGLIRYYKSTGKWELYNMQNGLPNNTIYSIIPCNRGQLWCSSNKGIFAFHKKTHDVRSFTSRDGLIDDEFNRYYYMVLPDSSFAYGGPLGYTIFQPAAIRTDEYDPTIALTSVSISNLKQLPQPLTSLDELRLSHDQNFITVQFATMQFDFPDKISYRYQLKGFDKDWIISGNENKVSYTSLPPGKYTLMLNASNTSGKWSSHVYNIRILITPPFWQTWWFYGLIVAVTGSLIYLFLRQRIRYLKKIHARQLQFEREAMELHAMALRAQMNPHFIFNCLNSIKALIQEKENDEATRYLTTFVSLIRRQLNHSSNRISLADELQTCHLYLEMEAMRFDERIRYQIQIPQEDWVKQVMLPPLTIQPIIENAIIHGILPKEEGGYICVKVYRDNDEVICEIQDNGIGRAASAKLKEKSSPLHQSKGMHLLKERMTLHSLMDRRYNSIETTDLYHENGEAAGTLVTIKLNMDHD